MAPTAVSSEMASAHLSEGLVGGDGPAAGAGLVFQSEGTCP
jgi:hypothetical protein